MQSICRESVIQRLFALVRKTHVTMWFYFPFSVVLLPIIGLIIQGFEVYHLCFKEQFSKLSVFGQFHQIHSETLRIDHNEYNQFSNQTVNEVLAYQRKKQFHPETPSFALQIFESMTIKYRVCRFHNSCISQNSVPGGKLHILIHPFFKQHAQEIQEQCAISVQYLNDSTLYNQSTYSSNFDLFGLRFPRTHMPHFFSDFRPSLIAYNVMTDNSSDRINRTCVTVENDRGCNDFSFRLAHFFPQKYMSILFSHWVPQLLSVLSKDWYFYGQQSWEEMNKDITCFKSIIQFHGGKAIRVHSLNWDRASSIGQPPTRNNSKTPQITVVIIDRKKERGRNIWNLSELTDYILRIQSSKCSTFKKPNISVVYMEDLTFKEQVQSIKMANIVIGSHGAGLTNLIFARPGTEIFEICPFKYCPPLFKGFAHQFLFNYTSIVALPDSETYIACAESRKSRGALLIDVWRRALELQKYPEKVIHPIALDSYLSGLDRMCSRAQQLRIDMVVFGAAFSEIIDRLTCTSDNQLN